MTKPDVISDLESKLNTKLFHGETLRGSGFLFLNNSYLLDNAEKVIALNVSFANTTDFSFLSEFPSLVSLDISYNNISDISFLTKLPNLQYVNLNSNLIDNLASIEKLGNLIKVNLNNNNVDDIRHLKGLSKLESLELYNNSITSLQYLAHLTSLKFLHLGCNKIENLNGVEDLINLEILDVTENGVTELSLIGKLRNLKKLYFSYNQLKDISGIANLTNLKILHLHNNETVSNFECLKALVNLHELDISSTHIDNINFIKDLTQLISLNLSNNEITSLEPLTKLNKLRNLNATNNLVDDLSPILKLAELADVYLEGNKKVEIDFPPEVLNSSWEAVKQFSEKSKEVVKFENVKVLLLGNSCIGKSTLVEYLANGKFIDVNLSTHGVNYKKILIDNIAYHIWDFGGQEYFHATHKLFFSSNALNIILWEKDVNTKLVETSETFSLKYWLRTVEQLVQKNRDEKVFIVENKLDLNVKGRPTPINQVQIVSDFETLNLSFAHISIKESIGLGHFNDLLKTLAESIVDNFRYPAFYEVFLKRILALDKDFVTIDEINHRPHKENAVAAIEVFHKMGLLLYFPTIIRDKIFVKPEILLNLIYNAILHDITKEKISAYEIYVLTSNNSLELTVDQIVMLLKQFKLIFEIDVEKDVFFIPQYLKPPSPWIAEFQELSFKYRSILITADNFLMGQAMLEVFSEYGNFVIGKESKEYKFWNNGIFIKKNEQTLLIKFLREEQLIEIYEDIKGENFSLQKEVVDFILDLPEPIYLKKRHLKNHAKSRFNEVQDMEHEDYAPHLMELLEEDGAYQEFINKGYDAKVDWSSRYFSVSVSIDGEYFIDWVQLKKDKDLQQVKVYSKDEANCTILEVSEFNKFIDIKKIKMEKLDDKDSLGSMQFNGPVNIASMGSGNIVRVENQNSNVAPRLDSENRNPVNTVIKKDIKIGLSAKEKKAIKRWKGLALLILIVSLIFTTLLLSAFYNEWTSIMTLKEWEALKTKKWLPIIAPILLFSWNAFISKITYDRFFDPSKENSFIDLHRKKN